MKLNNRNFKPLWGAAFATMVLSQPVQALDNDLTVYLWGTGITGTATINQQTIPFEADFDEIIDNLDMGFMAHYEGMGDQWGVGLDFAYVDLSNTNDADVKGTLKSNLSEAFAIYRASSAIDLLGGARFTDMDMTISAPGAGKAEGDRSLTDFFVGARFSMPFSDTWRGALRADVGAGDSDLVWNINAILDWQVSKSVAMRAGYRWLDYELDKDDAQLDNSLDLSLDGPFLGIGFQW